MKLGQLSISGPPVRDCMQSYWGPGDMFCELCLRLSARVTALESKHAGHNIQIAM